MDQTHLTVTQAGQIALQRLLAQLKQVEEGQYETVEGVTVSLQRVIFHRQYMEESEEERVTLVRGNGQLTAYPARAQPHLELLYQSQLWGSTLHVALFLTSWKDGCPYSTRSLMSWRELHECLQRLASQKRYVPVAY